MNKRIKKKCELEERLRIAESHIDFLIYENNRLNRLVEQNAQATNNEFEVTREKIHEMRTKRVLKRWW